MKHFRPYLYGQVFRLRTGHASLQWLSRKREPSHQVARWLELLAEFQYKTEHRQRVKHGNADGLSRRECIGCKPCTRIEERDGGPTHQELETSLGTTPTDSTPTEPTAEIQTIDNHYLAKQQSERESPIALIFKPSKRTALFLESSCSWAIQN